MAMAVWLSLTIRLMQRLVSQEWYFASFSEFESKDSVEKTLYTQG